MTDSLGMEGDGRFHDDPAPLLDPPGGPGTVFKIVLGGMLLAMLAIALTLLIGAVLGR